MPTSHSLPMYVQISEMLIRDIQAGRLLDGERLPPEREMAGQLGVSVGTLRKSLADLTAKGLLKRLHGSGNYIRNGPAVDSIYAFFRLELVDGGGLPTADVLSVTTLVAPDGLAGRGLAHRIRRLRKLSGRPAAIEEIWLDAVCSPTLEAGDLSESLYHFYRNSLGLWIQKAEDRIGIGPVPDWGGGLLPGAAESLCVVDRVSWDQHGRNIEISRTWYDSRHVRYVARLK